MFWCHKSKHLHFFTKDYLQRTVQHVIKCFHFELGNQTILQTIVIPMGIDPATFWDNVYLEKHKCDFMSKIIKQDISPDKNLQELSYFCMVFLLLMMVGNLKFKTGDAFGTFCISRYFFFFFIWI